MKLGGNVVMTFLKVVPKFVYDELNIADINTILQTFDIPVVHMHTQ